MPRKQVVSLDLQGLQSDGDGGGKAQFQSENKPQRLSCFLFGMLAGGSLIGPRASWHSLGLVY